MIDRWDAPDNLAPERIVVERVGDECILRSAFAQGDVEQFPVRASDDRVRVKPQPVLEGLAPCVEPAMNDYVCRVRLDPAAGVLVTMARLWAPTRRLVANVGKSLSGKSSREGGRQFISVHCIFRIKTAAAARADSVSVKRRS